MPNTNTYADLTPFEKKEFVAKIIHVVNKDQETFITINSILRSADNNGLFDGVNFFENENVATNE